MSRRVAEVVHVGVQGHRPTAFRWRGNRYEVHEVLGHWRERRSWWLGGTDTAQVAARGALPIGGSATGEPDDVRRSAGGRGGGSLQEGGQALFAGSLRGLPVQRTWNTALTDEYEIWRVEAARSHGGLHTCLGVYDLCHAAGSHPDTGCWRLLRVVD